MSSRNTSFTTWLSVNRKATSRSSTPHIWYTFFRSSQNSALPYLHPKTNTNAEGFSFLGFLMCLYICMYVLKRNLLEICKTDTQRHCKHGAGPVCEQTLLAVSGSVSAKRANACGAVGLYTYLPVQHCCVMSASSHPCCTQSDVGLAAAGTAVLPHVVS